MKINKFKAILVAICCLVTTLWAEIQGMEERRDVPTGCVVSFAGEVAPQGWLLCDGQQHSSLTYPELYDVVKEKYAPENIRAFLIERNRAAVMEKTFYVPDLRGRVIVGVDGGAGRVTAHNILGASSGEENVIMTVDQMPKHNHRINLASGSNGIHSAMNAIGGNFYDDRGNTIEFSGENQPHNNMQPYTCLNYIINIGETNGQQNEIVQLRQKIDQLEISQQGCAKAWVCFNGSGAILQSYGISSVIKNATGVYTVNFSRPFNSENYCYSLNVKGKRNAMGAGSFIADDNSLIQERGRFTFQTWVWTTRNCEDGTCVSAIFYGS